MEPVKTTPPSEEPPKPREHTAAPDCWCEPELEYTSDTGVELWVHREIH